MINILVVDDEKNLRRTLCIALEELGYNVTEAAGGKEAMKYIFNEIYDIVLTDLKMDEIDGVELLREVKKIDPVTEVLLMSAHGTIPRAVEAMQEGAFDFIVKPFSIEQLEIILKKVLNQLELKKTIKHLKAVIADHYPIDDIIAVSQEMKNVLHQTVQVADWPVPVLIQGGSGVGKELIALALHHLSSRKNSTFVPINCGAFPDTLLDSELFGHCKGSFTGASVNKRGLVEEADGGTLLLDEIGEAPPALQVRLLRFLDNGRFRRVGEVKERSSDVRIIAATNKNLNQYIKEDKFREDLFYRLSVAVISIPPLKERKEDITPLVKYFMKLYSKKMDIVNSKIHPQVISVFYSYDWPGNVRELENTIEHALIVSESGEITIKDLPDKFRGFRTSGELNIDGTPSLKEVQRRYILSILRKTNGNKKRAAGILKISRTTLISRLKSYKVDDLCSNNLKDK